MWHKILMIQLI